MTSENQAEKDGYRFSGVYSSYEDEYVKQRAKEYRALGYKAICVNNSTGKSVYIKHTEKSLEYEAEEKRKLQLKTDIDRYKILVPQIEELKAELELLKAKGISEETK